MSGTNSNPPQPSPAVNANSAQPSYNAGYAPVRPSPSPAPLTHSGSFGSHGSTQSPVQPSPIYQPQNYNQYATASTPHAQHQTPISNFQYQNSHTQSRAVAPSTGSHPGHTNAYNPPSRNPEAWTLGDVANASIPADVREQFQQDELGRVIFFTAPPLDSTPITEDTKGLGHSLRYLADKARRKEEDEKKRKIRLVELEEEATQRLKRRKATQETTQQRGFRQNLEAMLEWSEQMDKGTDELYKKMHGDNWRQAREEDLVKLAVKQEEAYKQQKHAEEFQKSRESKDVKITGFKWI
jgi:chromatin structure-remodeling complex subunit RSC1/2